MVNYTQVITITDTTAPTFTTSPADVTVACDASTAASATGTAAASDNCDSSVTITSADTTVAGTGNNSVITRVWTATDDNGNAATYTQTITISADTTAPTFTTSPADVTVECDASTDPVSTCSTSDGSILPGTYTVDMQDSYGDGWQGNGISISIDGNITTATLCDSGWGGTTVPGCVGDGSSGSLSVNVPAGTQLLSFTAEYDSYPSERSVQVYDPNGALIFSESGLNSGAMAVSIPENTVCTYNEVVATDNCDSDVTITYSDSLVSGTGNNSVITRVWTAIDDNGNAATHTQTITVLDTTAPTFTTSPGDVTVECDASSDPSATGTAVATDNCDSDVTVSYADTTTSTSITRVWTATDDNGNAATYTQT